MRRGIILCCAMGMCMLGMGSAAAVSELTKPQKVIPRSPMHLQCWQYGVKIMDERGLYDMRTNLAIEQGTLSFTRNNDNQPSVFVSVTGTATCLVKGEP
jgi:hypothetical protein